MELGLSTTIGGSRTPDSPETEKWVADEMAYTRALLDPLPGREAIHKRLTELLSIGNVTAPAIAGHHYFYTKREGHAEPAGALRARRLDGADRVLVDANQLAADGTIALDWFQPSRERQICRVWDFAEWLGDVDAARHRNQDRHDSSRHDRAHACGIDRLAARQFWFLLHALSEEGRRAWGQEMYNRHVFFHLLGTILRQRRSDLWRGPRSRGLAERASVQ